MPAVQTMTNVDTADGVLLLSEVERLSSAGAEMIRATVNNENAVKGFEYVCKRTKVPMIADVHFDYKLAILAAKAGASKVRINPGNMGKGVGELCQVCNDFGVAIRVGVNKGSLDKDLIEKYGKTPKAMAESALRRVELLEKHNFYNTVISVKSSDVKETVQANRILSQITDYPLHLGVTEAGGGDFAVMKSAIGIGSLLLDGIGDTIRVSLSDDPIKEVQAGIDILRAIGLDKNFVEVISCPTCGRTEYDVIGIAERLRESTKSIKKRLKVAVMGCVVNGIGESADADLGIAGGRDKSVIFEKGKKILTVDNDKVEAVLNDLITKRVNNVQ